MGQAALPAVASAALMAGIVLLVDAMLPPLAAPVRLAVLVTAGGLSFAAILFGLARETARDLLRLLGRKNVPAAA